MNNDLKIMEMRTAPQTTSAMKLNEGGVSALDTSNPNVCSSIAGAVTTSSIEIAPLGLKEARSFFSLDGT